MLKYLVFDPFVSTSMAKATEFRPAWCQQTPRLSQSCPGAPRSRCSGLGHGWTTRTSPRRRCQSWWHVEICSCNVYFFKNRLNFTQKCSIKRDEAFCYQFHSSIHSFSQSHLFLQKQMKCQNSTNGALLTVLAVQLSS